MARSYMLYIFTVLSATLFAALAQKYSQVNRKGIRIPNSFFWFISMFILIFIMGFRKYTVGVDGDSYIGGYYDANSVGIIEYYLNNTTEPGFYFLYRLVYFIFDDYQWLFIITAVITITCFYKAFSYEIENVSLALTIFVFASTQYFYYFGIMRMGIAVSIVAIAYRYILQNKKKKYIFMVLLATMFHYSALFALIALFIKYDSHCKFKQNTIIKIIIMIPLAFFSVRLFVYPFISVDRYQKYIDSETMINIRALITTTPFLVVFSIFYNKLKKASINYQFYFMLFVVKIVTEVFDSVIGIGRMVWYVNLSLCYLLPATIRINKDYIIKFTIIIFTILYCVFYSYYAYFSNFNNRGAYMLPYSNMFFDL